MDDLDNIASLSGRQALPPFVWRASQDSPARESEPIIKMLKWLTRNRFQSLSVDRNLFDLVKTPIRVEIAATNNAGNNDDDRYESRQYSAAYVVGTDAYADERLTHYVR